MLILSILVPVERPIWALPFSLVTSRLLSIYQRAAYCWCPWSSGVFVAARGPSSGGRRLVSLAWPTGQLQGNNLFTTGLREAESAICRRLCLRLLTPNSNAPFFSLILQQVPLSISIQKSQDRGDFEQSSRGFFFLGLSRAIEWAFERLRC